MFLDQTEFTAAHARCQASVGLGAEPSVTFPPALKPSLPSLISRVFIFMLMNPVIVVWKVGYLSRITCERTFAHLIKVPLLNLEHRKCGLFRDFGLL